MLPLLKLIEKNTQDKQARFDALAESARYCTLCPRMCERTRVLSSANGSLKARVMFIAEAPGRLGADRTGIPLHGDRSGDNFESLIANIGWSRDDLFVTNAVLCNPRAESGNNGTPTQAEVENCATYLRMTIELVAPDVVVTLGATALRSIDLIAPHGLALRDAVAQAVPWAGRLLFPLYHTGSRALIHRGLSKQRSDFFALARLVEPRRGLKSKRSASLAAKAFTEASAFHEIVKTIVDQLGDVSYFKLTKLLYLIDYTALESLGEKLSGQVYLRQQEGPWAPSLKDAVAAMNGFEVRSTIMRGRPHVQRGPSPRFRVGLEEDALRVILDTIDRYGSRTDAEIKTAAYLTRPMRDLLRAEKTGARTRNTVVL